MRARLRVYDTKMQADRGLLPFRAGTLTFSSNVDGDGAIQFTAAKADVDALPAWVCGITVELEHEPGSGVWVDGPMYALRAEWEQDAGSQMVTLYGRELLGQWLNETLVMPEAIGADTWPSMSEDGVRHVGWMSSAYDPAADLFGEPWSLCTQVPGSVAASSIYPKGWPDGTGAKWITAAGDWRAYQEKYFRAWLDVPADPANPAAPRKVRFYLAAEEASQLFVGGQLVLEGEWSEGQWRNSYARRTVLLLPGRYAVGIKNDSIEGKKSGGFNGYDPTLFAAGLLNADGKIASWLLHSSAGTFRACRREEDGRPPGPTPGQVLRYILDEAKDRSATGWDTTTYGFTGAADSYGQPWADAVTEREWRIGETYFDVVQALAESGDLDLWITPARVVHAAPKRGQARPGFVWDQDKLASLRARGSGYRGTWVMAQAANRRWYSRARTGVYRREYLLTLGQASSKYTAQRVMKASLADAVRWDGTGRLRIPQAGWRPYEAYDVGDWMSLSYKEQSQNVCVQGLSARGGEGGLLWEVELTEYPLPEAVDEQAGALH